MMLKQILQCLLASGSGMLWDPAGGTEGYLSQLALGARREKGKRDLKQEIA